MGYIDTITKEYMRENTVFADAFNYYIYNGRKVIVPELLRELDVTEMALPFGSDIKHNGSLRDSVQKYRDILKSAVIMQDDTASYVLLGIENQTDVHYAMPVRSIIYDALQYGRQVSDIAAAHRKSGHTTDYHSKSEYLSGFYKDDYIIPVITLVLHFGANAWDGPLSLYDMMRINNNDELMRLVQNYQISLIDPAGVSEADLLKFSTSLREVVGYIKYSNDSVRLKTFITDNPRMVMDVNAAHVIQAVTKTPFKIDTDTEVVDVCKAIEDMKAEERAEGIAEGMAKGMAKGVAKGIIDGKISVLAGLVRDGMITLNEAAIRADMSEADFQDAAGKLLN